jgi:hypothetical protein
LTRAVKAGRRTTVKSAYSAAVSSRNAIGKVTAMRM